MSNTRHAEEGSPLRQERFCSSAEFERGLMGNLVARRCSVLDDPEARALIWFLQLLSHAPGGLQKVASDLVERFPERIGTKAMQKFGTKPGQTYNAEQVKTVRHEIDWNPRDESLRLKNETLATLGAYRHARDLNDAYEDSEEAERAKHFPSQYPAADFLKLCHSKAAALQEWLMEFCLNPELPTHGGPWYFPALVDTLREYMAAWIEAKRSSQVVTALGGLVYETLDYAAQGRCMVLIEGMARIGKSFAAKAWCELHPGQARYVQVPSSNDDIGFFRAIAKSLGVSINQNSKAQQLRDRIEDTLQRGGLALVFDEAHFLWPQTNCHQGLPGRISWIMTALVNQGVPVGLVTTPQFIKSQKSIEKKTCWTSEQFTGRIGHYQKLPDSLSADDLKAVARAFLPEGDTKSIELLMVYAQGSAKYLAAIESVARRARFLADKAKRTKVVFADLRSAINESVIPSDTALAAALSETKPQGRNRAIPVPAPTPGAATAMPRRNTRAMMAAPDRTANNLAANQPPGSERIGQELAAA